jgi:aminoglycoside 6'-N-acetyltransferase I
MDIKPINENNIEDCAKVFIQAYNKSPWNYNWNIDDAIIYLREYTSSPQFIGFVLLNNDQIAGALLAHTKTWWTNKQLFIDELFVSPEFQKMGFGDKLMTHIEEYAQSNNLQTITLMTHQYMPSMAFYAKKDFLHAQPFVILFKNLID